MEAQTKNNNRLWQARHKKGLEQKQVARLLGHKTVDLISRYERGAETPGLKNALKLELILQVPVSELFPEHYQNLRREIAERTSQLRLPTSTDEEFLLNEAFHICTYANLLLLKILNENDIELAKRHSIEMIERLSEIIHQRNRSH